MSIFDFHDSSDMMSPILQGIWLHNETNVTNFHEHIDKLKICTCLCFIIISVCEFVKSFMPLGFFNAWDLANNLLHLDNKNLALFDMSDLQVRKWDSKISQEQNGYIQTDFQRENRNSEAHTDVENFPYESKLSVH